MAGSARAPATEAVGLFQDVERLGDHESWLLSPEARGPSLGWTVAGGLGADLRRNRPVAQDEAEELVNTVTHALGLVLSLIGLYALAVITRMATAPGPGVGCAAYGVSMVFLYAASTLYHARPAGRGKRVLLLFDYVGIYLLIAGTYTPIVMISLGGPVGWSLLAAVWGFAVFGTGVKIGRFNRFEDDSALPYLVMGGVLARGLPADRRGGAHSRIRSGYWPAWRFTSVGFASTPGPSDGSSTPSGTSSYSREVSATTARSSAA